MTHYFYSLIIFAMENIYDFIYIFHLYLLWMNMNQKKTRNHYQAKQKRST